MKHITLGMFTGCLLAVLVLAVHARAGDADTDAAINNFLVGTSGQYRAAFDRLQQGVRNDDAAAVSKIVRYPISVTIKGKKATIKSASAFVKRYPEIISPDIASVIKSQKYADVMINDQGMMFGSGEIWINGICRDTRCNKADVRVITIQHTNQ